MKKFVVMLKDKKKGELKKDLLIKHVEHLQNQKNESKLLICGPFKDNDGALQILTCKSKEEAISIIEQDPFVKESYYAAYEIYELIEANQENNWLMDIPQTLENMS